MANAKRQTTLWYVTIFRMSNPYDQNPYAGGQPYGMAQPHPQGTMILIFGILGFVICPIFGVVAWVMGAKSLKEIDANPAAYNNRQNVNIGRILGIISTILWILMILFWIVVVVIIGASGTFNS